MVVEAEVVAANVVVVEGSTVVVAVVPEVDIVVEVDGDTHAALTLKQNVWPVIFWNDTP